ncbi:alcohol dehydrogenase catalytic domain-containing protein [Micromonospora sp. BRA006-A]|nr:alcohol dehydrogenase catalytic domain-containing protein [Micromonospora sp. BRA006-A]
MRALVVRGRGATPAVEDVRLPAPGPGELRVRIRAAGICHSDLAMVDGTLAPAYPLVLGHGRPAWWPRPGPAPRSRPAHPWC